MKINKWLITLILCLYLVPLNIAYSAQSPKATVTLSEKESKDLDRQIETLAHSGKLVPYIDMEKSTKWSYLPYLTNDPNVILAQFKSTDKTYFATFAAKKVKGLWNIQFLFLSDVPVSPVYILDMLFSAKMMAQLQPGNETLPPNIYVKNENYSPTKASSFEIIFFDKDRSVGVGAELIPDGKGGAYFNIKQPAKEKK